MQRTITLSDVIGWNPCWDDDSLMAYAQGRTEEETLTLLRDEELTLNERVWLAIRAMYPRERRIFACDCASRALDREEAAGRAVDPRSREVIRVARLYSDGRATIEELRGAEDAAMAAAYVSLDGREAAWAACEAGCRSSRIAAGSASWGAARAYVDADDERIRQLDWIMSEYLNSI